MAKWLFLAMSVMMLVPAFLLFYASKKAKAREVEARIAGDASGVGTCADEKPPADGTELSPAE